MADPDGDYAPQSPDLSAYHSSSYDQQLPQHSYYPQQPQQTYQASHGQPTNYGSYSYNSQITPQSAELYQQPTMPRNGQIKRRPEEDLEWAPDAPGRGSGRKGKKPAVEEFCDKPAPGVEEGIKVSTKFPVARIKRIMQADEDVGKVAQVTPTAVSKALELFMISVVTKAANEAKAKSSKRVTAAHLKSAVEKDEQLDFLAEIISKVPDAPVAKKDEDSEEAGEGKKKKGGGATRRRKRESDDF
ncbi:MAG: hypothetical protein LQ351_002784 [Letrouitia transgressa]|nr:MAG: hypothetical protein LQ351_002784 [Letrouitia transgressa]